MIRGIRLVAVSVALGAMAVSGTFATVYAAEKEKKEKEENPQQKLSPKVVKELQPAQEAMQKQDWETAATHLQAAQAVPDRTPFDDFQIAEMLGYTQLKREKYAESAAAFEQSLASGLLPPDQVNDRLKLVAQLHLQLKEYQKAIEFGNRYIAAAPEPPADVLALVGQSQYLLPDYPASVATMKKAIDAARKSGKAVDENWLQIELSGYVQLKDEPGVLATLKEIAIAYPQKKYLSDLFGQWKRGEKDDRVMLNLYRLMFEMSLLEFSEDYLRMAELATDMGLPGEAITVLERGNTDKKFSEEGEQSQYKKLLASAKTVAVNDRKTLATLQAGGGSKSGEEDAQLGAALASYGEYDKAAQLLQSAVTKGGVKRLDQAQIGLGYALYKLNRTADSQAAFASVDASSPLKTVAQLWHSYTQQPLPAT